MARCDDLERVMLGEDELAEGIGKLASQIQQDYAGKSPLLVAVLRGSFMFLADLVRQLDINLSIDFIAVSTYHDSTTSSGEICFEKKCSDDVAGRHVLIIEDIIDTGFTLHETVKWLWEQNPATVRVCCLLDKPARRDVEFTPDYVGFTIPDEFVVGYGLDYAQQYRNLPYVAVLKPSAYQG